MEKKWEVMRKGMKESLWIKFLRSILRWELEEDTTRKTILAKEQQKTTITYRRVSMLICGQKRQNSKSCTFL